jgi:cystinosin
MLIVLPSEIQPQILLNFKRKSTKGFAIMGITLDFTGGLLSLMQLFIDAQIINHDWAGVKGDPGKLGLAFISIVFDVILLGEFRLQRQKGNS